MSRLLTLIMLLVGCCAHSQRTGDTCLTWQQLSDLNYNLYQQAETIQHQRYRLQMLTDLKRTDTVSNTKDSIVINYKGANNLPFKTLRKFYNDTCMRDSALTYFNGRGLVEYQEHWASDCQADTINGKPSIFYVKTNYSRYEYDSLSRVTKYVFRASSTIVRRVVYIYNNTGAATTEIFKITDMEFWE